MEVSGQLHTLATLPPDSLTATHWIGGWVGPRLGLDAVEKTFIPLPQIEPRFLSCPVRSIVIIPTDLSWLP
jgi:hypothetical protein